MCYSRLAHRSDRSHNCTSQALAHSHRSCPQHMLSRPSCPRGGYSGGGSVVAVDGRGSLGSLSSCSNHCEVQGNWAWHCMLGVEGSSIMRFPLTHSEMLGQICKQDNNDCQSVITGQLIFLVLKKYDNVSRNSMCEVNAEREKQPFLCRVQC